MRDLCKDCHDFIHAEALIVDEIKHCLNVIKFWVEHFKSKNAQQALRKIDYRVSRLKLLTKRLEVLRALNNTISIKKYGYRSYWIDPKTHVVETL
jgi:hypothetical protein